MRTRIVSCLILIASLSLAMAQSPDQDENPVISGGPFLGGGAFFDLQGDASDLSLEMGGMVDVRLGERLGAVASAGFMANVSDNDAYMNRSGFYTAGLRYSLSAGKLAPFLSGGYALGGGEGLTHHFGFAGAGLRYWYGKKIGLQFEVRDYISSDINFLQGRISVLLK